MRPRVLWLVGAAVLASSLGAGGRARAADRRAEGAAKAALKKAAHDYLQTHYRVAASRLSKAVRACGKARCTASTRALLLRDLGTMQFRNGDVGTARQSWARAFKLDSLLDLNPDYDTPDVRRAWQDAKGVPGAAAQPTGDFAHAPAPEQKARTPLPVYVEVSGDLAVARVVVKYRGASMSAWKRIDLKRTGHGWGAVLPCGDVTTGTMRYWVQGLDRDGDPVASSGDPTHPFTVAIRDAIAGPPPHLPGQPAPQTCGGDSEGGEDADCPPGLQGCRQDEGGSGESGAGQPHGEAGNAPPPEGESGTGGGVGAADAPLGAAYARWWFGLSGAADFLSLPQGSDVCKLTSSVVPANPANYFCTNPDGTDFPSRATPDQNNELNGGQAGLVSGGLQPGNVRVMLAADYAMSASLLVGARVGYVLNAYTGQAAVQRGMAWGPKLHLEARATYLLGDHPLARVGFAPMVFLGLGLSEFDGRSTSVIHLANIAGDQPVNAWLTDGPFFVAAGGGARYQFSPRAAFTAAARVNAVTGGNGFLLTYGPEIAVLYGF